MNVLVAAALEPFLRPTEIPAQLHVDVVPEEAPLPSGDHVGLIPHVALRVDARALDRLPRLRVIANFGVGVDNIDLAAAQRRGIVVTNTPGVLTGATAELTWALILAVARRVGEGERLARSGAWTGWTPTQLLGTGLDGRTLGVVGAGRIGAEVARRAPAFGMRAAYWSRTRRPDLEDATGAAYHTSLETLLASCDVVSIHLPLTPGTRALIDARALARMRPRAILINTSRGGVIDEAALVDAVERGTLRVGLDVYTDEPRIPERLLRLENVTLLPHLGSATEETRMAMWRLAWDNLTAVLADRPPLTPL